MPPYFGEPETARAMDTNLLLVDFPQSKDDVRSSVCFEEMSTVYPVPSHNDMTEVERDTLWYSDNDLADAKLDMRRVVTAMRSGTINDDVDCARGLEHLASKEYFDRRKENKAAVINAVLKEQNMQRLTGLSDVSAICDVSSAHSKWSKGIAADVALKDAEIVRSQDLYETQQQHLQRSSSHSQETEQTRKRLDDCISVLDSAIELTESQNDEPIHPRRNRRRRMSGYGAGWEIAMLKNMAEAAEVEFHTKSSGLSGGSCDTYPVCGTSLPQKDAPNLRILLEATGNQ